MPGHDDGMGSRIANMPRRAFIAGLGGAMALPLAVRAPTR
jgi:hypothetical protein